MSDTDEIRDDEPDTADNSAWDGSDLEQAYLKALEAVDAVAPIADESMTTISPPCSRRGFGGLPTGDAEVSSDPTPISAPVTTALAQPTTADIPAIDVSSPGDALPVTPGQIIEAALFVGGSALTAKKLCALLRGSFDSAFVVQTIDELNAEYVSQARPYEIRLGDGGYRLVLRPEYERLRSRVYGTGPREVRLSQETLEVLALVAYQQPISKKDVESYRENAGSVLRQLLQRELIALHRGDGGRDDIAYTTTPRFLSLFGLGSLEDLPRPDDVDVK